MIYKDKRLCVLLHKASHFRNTFKFIVFLVKSHNNMEAPWAPAISYISFIIMYHAACFL